MKTLRIQGGKPLSGEITVSGNKNAVLPMLAAALLTDEAVTLHNVPGIRDVDAMLDIAMALGVEVTRKNGSVTLQAANIRTTSLPRELCDQIRTSVLFTAPLLARCGQAEIWPPGGDVIGRRRLDGHFYGLRTLGAQVDNQDFPYKFAAKSLIGRDLFLDEASVTATEQILLAAVLAEGQTVLMNAAAEPHVCDLAYLLQAMGAEINGIGTNTLTITGVKSLHGTEHTVVGDHIEAGSFLCLAAATGGEITVNGTVRRHHWMTHRIFERFGLEFEIRANSLFLPGGQSLSVKPDAGNAIPTISDGPWPQYPSDMMSCTIVMATQATGTVLFFEKMFESRIYFVDRLIGMGANAIVCDPHRVVISGPSNLRPTTLSSPDIRAGMALVIAACTANGESLIQNAEVIERGYQNVVEKLASLGADIETISS